MEATGRTIPRPFYELAEVDWEWENSVYVCLSYLRYLRDYAKLDPEQRKALESIQE